MVSVVGSVGFALIMQEWKPTDPTTDTAFPFLFNR
jgi:hypothetical protein